MNYKESLKSASACIRSLEAKLKSETALHTQVENFQALKMKGMHDALQMYRADNREHCELVDDLNTRRKVIDAQSHAIDAREKAIVELEAARAAAVKRANAAESVQELANIKIDQLQYHRLFLAGAVMLFLVKDAFIYFGVL